MAFFGYTLQSLEQRLDEHELEKLTTIRSRLQELREDIEVLIEDCIIRDVAYPADFHISQEDALSGFTPRLVDASEVDALSPDDFAELPMLIP